MIYIDNDTSYSQRIYIPKDENDATSGVTGHTVAYQSKEYIITENGTTRIHPDAGYDAITGGSIGVYVTAATGVTFEHLHATENGLYVPSGETAYSGVTVEVDLQTPYEQGYDDGYQEGETDGYNSGHTEGYASGRTDGYNEGYTNGYNDGYLAGYDEGFASGHTSGFNEGYASGVTDGYSSGYTEGSKDGYSEGYTSGSTDGYQEGYNVGFSAGYTSGHTDGFTAGYNAGLIDGAANQKAMLTSGTITRNGEYTRENGWSALTVTVPDGGYQEGYDAGVADQKSLLGFHLFTANTGSDPVVFPDGLSGVTVNIPYRDMLYTATTNGTYDYFADPYPYGHFQFVVDVEQTGSTPTLVSTAFTENGSYSPPAGVDGFSTVQVALNTAQTFIDGYSSGVTDGYASGYTEGVDWRHAQDIPGTFTANGTYTRQNGYGWIQVKVDVPTASTYNSGYTSGYTDGVAYQKGLLGSTGVTANGTYTKPEGWSSVTVNVDTGATYQSGYDAGVAWRDSQDIRGVFTENKTYTRSNTYGWNEVVVRVDTASTYNAGYSSGVTYQKSLLATTSITANGVYTRENGWKKVTVNVPLTGLTVTANGTYTPSAGGYNNVVVNVPTTTTVVMTAQQYADLAVKDNNTIYLIRN